MSFDKNGVVEEGGLQPNNASAAISIRGLAKCYQIYDKPGDRLRQFLLPRLRRLFGRVAKRYFREFWALRNVSFDIKKGEVVGIIGRNGSGKSTLLQIICGTLAPTVGSVETNGRIAALLELGSGFNPEFTGRDNVYMNAALMGLSRDEVDQRFGEIVAFADIGDFIEQPVKTYSSGMAVRLAFAVAINVDPEILIVDEALSVGDELFQRKCFSRIESLRGRGATILFVSHAGGTVIELCDRAVLLDSGEMLAVGSPKNTVGQYQKLLYAPADKAEALRNEIRANGRAIGHEEVKLQSVGDAVSVVVQLDEQETFDSAFTPNNTIIFECRGARIAWPVIRTMDGRQVNGLVRGREYRYCYGVHFDQTCAGVRFGMLIKTITGMPLGGALSEASIHEGLSIVEGKTVSVEFRFRCQLNPGVYFMNAGVFGCPEQEEVLLHRLSDAVAFRVLPVSSNRAQEIIDFGCTARVTIDA